MDYLDNLLDIKEDYIYNLSPELLDTLLIDHSSKKNIIWATDNYSSFGKGYGFSDEIKTKKITTVFNSVIKPRVNKTKSEQEYRIKEKAEVFTPAYICNKQNNQIDYEWFKKKNVFNKETEKGWMTNKKPIEFRNKSWIDYICDKRLEISCGEAPYLVSRYDAVSGKIIPVDERIGIFDRKLRVVCENTKTKKQWINSAQIALKSVYGYEWQGDSLLLARENILFTVIDYYMNKFNSQLENEYLLEFANIISWNIWQMDGIKFVIPASCKRTKSLQIGLGLFEDEEEYIECPGCKKGNNKMHNGIYCFIMDWDNNKKVKFIDIVEEE